MGAYSVLISRPSSGLRALPRAPVAAPPSRRGTSTRAPGRTPRAAHVSSALLGVSRLRRAQQAQHAVLVQQDYFRPSAVAAAADASSSTAGLAPAPAAATPRAPPPVRTDAAEGGGGYETLSPWRASPPSPWRVRLAFDLQQSDGMAPAAVVLAAADKADKAGKAETAAEAGRGAAEPPPSRHLDRGGRPGSGNAFGRARKLGKALSRGTAANSMGAMLGKAMPTQAPAAALELPPPDAACETALPRVQIGWSFSLEEAEVHGATERARQRQQQRRQQQQHPAAAVEPEEPDGMPPARPPTADGPGGFAAAARVQRPRSGRKSGRRYSPPSPAAGLQPAAGAAPPPTAAALVFSPKRPPV